MIYKVWIKGHRILELANRLDVYTKEDVKLILKVKSFLQMLVSLMR